MVSIKVIKDEAILLHAICVTAASNVEGKTSNYHRDSVRLRHFVEIKSRSNKLQSRFSRSSCKSRIFTSENWNFI